MKNNLKVFIWKNCVEKISSERLYVVLSERMGIFFSLF